ncbi:hypothetical protein Pan44_27840 [Caulifigura coniformis]|uniref:Carboxypeptidase regulatory-like domain-containing protein n=1 Tax=Caulifigura coniformis TaxID=2527983 RepID=A0A517SF63_9PLAN|nr:hypothetical protein [Caulifigura coniformis]QDT54748.1 hypothetical protein Pan44_27840 [Caulifigura coniformis]
MLRSCSRTVARVFGASVCLAGLCLVMVGCGESGAPGRAEAKGTVTIDGRPLEKGTVFLVNEKGLPAGVGNVVAGAFELSENASTRGVLPGSYGVKIESWKVEPGAVLENGSFSPGELAIPKKFTDAKTSGLKAEVKDGANEFTFALNSK